MTITSDFSTTFVIVLTNYLPISNMNFILFIGIPKCQLK